MRIGIVSDIHGNINGLDTALERMGSVDQVWCAGDAFDQYRFSNEVVGRLREIRARYILGSTATRTPGWRASSRGPW